MIEQPNIPTPAQVLAHELRASPRTAPESSGAAACSAGWKTIDTAPRNGTRFVAMKYGTHPTTAYWALGMKEPTFVFDGWSSDPNALTHWIPLPNAATHAPGANEKPLK